MNHGIPSQVIESAQQGASRQDLDVAKMIENLEISQKQAQRAQGEADRLADRVRELEQMAHEKIQRAELAMNTAKASTADEVREIVHRLKLDSDTVLSSINQRSSQRDIDDARSKLKEILSQGETEATRISPTKSKTPNKEAKVSRGDSVKIVGHTQVGTVIEDPKSGKVTVQLGAMKMKVSLSDIVKVQTPPQIKVHSQSLRLQKGLNASTEIHLRRMRAEDAQEKLEDFLDEAVLAGLPSVRIVHGKGEGVLRKMCQELLRKHPHVKSFYEAPADQGGQGVTVAEFK